MIIRYSKQSIKYINKQDTTTKLRIKLGIEGLTKEPQEGDIKTMSGTLDGDMRLRIGNLRIIFTLTKEIVDNKEVTVLTILKIKPRGDIYK